MNIIELDIALKILEITLPDEQWRPVPGFERYMVSNLARVVNTDTGKLKKTTWSGRDRKKYRSVQLSYSDGTLKKLLLHRVVWVAFNGEVPDGHHVDHKDRDNLHNHLDNLRCVTIVENMANKGVFMCKEPEEEIPF